MEVLAAAGSKEGPGLVQAAKPHSSFGQCFWRAGEWGGLANLGQGYKGVCFSPTLQKSDCGEDVMCI